MRGCRSDRAALDYEIVRTSRGCTGAKRATLKRLELDPGAGRGPRHWEYILGHEFDWPGALDEFAWRPSLRPGYATAHKWHARRCSDGDAWKRRRRSRRRSGPISHIADLNTCRPISSLQPAIMTARSSATGDFGMGSRIRGCAERDDRVHTGARTTMTKAMAELRKNSDLESSYSWLAQRGVMRGVQQRTDGVAFRCGS